MDGITVASTTDTMEDVNQAAGIEEPEQLEAPEQKKEDKPEEQPKATPELQTQPKPTKSAAQRRFDALTREIHELKAKLEARETPATEAEPQPATAKEPPSKPVFADFQKQGKTYDDYVEALTDWKVEQKEAQRAQAAEQQAEQERIQATISAFNERMAAAKAKYEDFDETLSENVPLHPAVRDAIIELENGPEVAYYLGKNREIAEQMMKLTPVSAIARVGKISAEIGTGDVVSEKPDSEIAEEDSEELAPPEPKPKAKSAAPAPIRPVGGSATKSSVPMDELSYSEYRKIRDQQQKARYRR